ncbi:hypothetical protein D3C78_1436190 [compost metagenome]
MEQQLAVGVIRMPDCQIREECRSHVHSGRLYHNGCDRAMDIRFTCDRDLFVGQKRVGETRHNAHRVLQGGPALDGNG